MKSVPMSTTNPNRAVSWEKFSSICTTRDMMYKASSPRPTPTLSLLSFLFYTLSMDQSPPVISQQVFGSSRKIQLINVPSPAAHSSHRQTLAPHSMSIESLLDSNGDPRIRDDDDEVKDSTAKRKVSHALERSNKIRKCMARQPDQAERTTTTIITCLHAAVAQKSYGSEKRYLCPPPIVQLEQPSRPFENAQVSMAVVCENKSTSEQRTTLDDDDEKTMFKRLHVTGAKKSSKQFSLRVSFYHDPSHEVPFASFLSNPISIISKPSKKTSKAPRSNVSTTCILANTPVSLFNRINSQTVRTKYMTSEGGRLCAKNSSWSPFEISIVRQHPCMAVAAAAAAQQRPPSAALPVMYGTEIVLKDTATGVSSPPVIVRKVEKNRIAPCAYGPVSQMAKIALQIASSSSQQQQQLQRPMYLSATGINIAAQVDGTGRTSTLLEFTPSQLVQGTEEVDDFLCWTIVGISRFEYRYHSSGEATTTTTTTTTAAAATTTANTPARRVLTPFPILTSVEYRPDTHSLVIVGQHLVQNEDEQPRLLECWLGNSHGPLPTEWHGKTRTMTVRLPSFVVPSEGRLELPLLFVRQDEMVYHSGKALLWDAGRWTVTTSTIK